MCVYSHVLVKEGKTLLSLFVLAVADTHGVVVLSVDCLSIFSFMEILYFIVLILMYFIVILFSNHEVIIFVNKYCLYV